MNKFINLLFALSVVLFATNVLAWNPPVSPKPSSAISDTSNVLSGDAHLRLDAQLTKINTNSANEIAVLILPSLDGESLEDVSIQTAKSWGVGKKDLDNGVLIVLAMKERRSRIETGKGVEGDLPDLKCNDILQNVLRPHMRKSDVEGGLSATIDAIATSISNHKSEVAKSSSNNNVMCDVSNVGQNAFDPVWKELVVIVGLGLVFVLLSRSMRRKQQDELTEVNKAKEFLHKVRVAHLQQLEDERREMFNRPTVPVVVPIIPKTHYHKD